MSNNINKCEGCRTLMDSRTFTETFFGCPSKLTSNADKCPCTTCLIKGICNTVCEEYKDFSNKLLPVVARYTKRAMKLK